MKSLRLFILTSLLVPAGLMAQSFEGKIVYKITYKNLPPEMQQMAGMMPGSQTLWIKGPKSRYEQNTQQANTIVISDADSGSSTLLMEAMGQKYKLEISKEEMEQMISAQKMPEIKYIDGTKEIAGYTCKKAEVVMEGMDGPALFYYTEEIPPVQVKGMEALQLKGMFMAYEVSTKGITINIEASSIDKNPVDDNLFAVPGGYTAMPAQMKAMMGIK